MEFTPSITIDNSWYQNQKYPMGFSIAFTSSPITNNLVGGKQSGLGYDGLMNSIAIEFDFIQNLDMNDIRDPHVSIHYNLNGALSSRSEKDCKVCNIKLPNFYVIFIT